MGELKMLLGVNAWWRRQDWGRRPPSGAALSFGGAAIRAHFGGIGLNGCSWVRL